MFPKCARNRRNPLFHLCSRRWPISGKYESIKRLTPRAPGQTSVTRKALILPLPDCQYLQLRNLHAYWARRSIHTQRWMTRAVSLKVGGFCDFDLYAVRHIGISNLRRYSSEQQEANGEADASTGLRTRPAPASPYISESQGNEEIEFENIPSSTDSYQHDYAHRTTQKEMASENTFEPWSTNASSSQVVGFEVETGKEMAAENSFVPWSSNVSSEEEADSEVQFEQQDPASPDWGNYNLNQRSQSEFDIISEFPERALSRRKVDLSYINVRKREANATQNTQEMHFTWKTQFRASSGLRCVLACFMVHFPYHRTVGLSKSSGIHNHELDELLLSVFDAEADEILSRNGYCPEHVLSWSWIFSTTSSTQQISRYLALSQDCRDRGVTRPPLFIPIQLLRLEQIDGPSLRRLWAEIVREKSWDADATALLAIRGLRHARQVDMSLCIDIVSFVFEMLPQRYNELKPDQALFYAQRLTHFYNRLLTLIALPSHPQPFRSVPVQQQAQLDVARFMQKSKPPIVVNREGYRAFVRVQLRHAKTTDEQEWARAKSPAWPPWRRDELGIQESIEYPGSQSRVIKVLQRMREAGYGPSEFEDVSQILAGWDTDHSPTVQVRRVWSGQPMAWLRSLVSKGEPGNEPTNHNIWAARVEATRSVREAWLCFHAYMEATQQTDRHYLVYNAMFQKMLARTLVNDPSLDVLPGDGKEVFADPISTRDLAYVPAEPPATEELYSQMLEDGIKPGGRLLANLLRSASSPDLVFQYVTDSTLDEVKRDVLLHAEKYPRAVISSILQQLPDYLLASFIAALACSNKGTNQSHVFQKPTSLSATSQYTSSIHVSPFVYARQLLEIVGTIYLPAYHALLSGLSIRARALQSVQIDRAQSSSSSGAQIWDTTLRIIELMNSQQVIPDHGLLRLVASIARFLPTSSVEHSPLHPQAMSKVLKCLFWFSLFGRTISEHDWEQRQRLQKLRVIPARSAVPGSVPTYKELEALFLAFSHLEDQEAVMSLLAWVDEGDGDKVFSTRLPHARRQMKASIRLAVEMLAGSQFSDSSDVIAEAMKLSGNLGWAADEDTREYMSKARAIYLT